MKPKRRRYTAKSLAGATREVRNLRKLIDQYENICRRLKRERNLMARLAAKTPQFSNPLVVMEAQAIRDEILQKRR